MEIDHKNSARPNRPTGCPVPREEESPMEDPSLDRTERILRWLGFKPYAAVAERAGLWWRGEHEFANLSAHISPSLDYLVLEKVRKDCTLNARDLFAMNLESLWAKRSPSQVQTPLQYLPGDYAEAARFLWEGE